VLLRHANVVAFYGCCLDGPRGVLLCEFCEGGARGAAGRLGSQRQAAAVRKQGLAAAASSGVPAAAAVLAGSEVGPCRSVEVLPAVDATLCTLSAAAARC
jgi:hypothetical protein